MTRTAPENSWMLFVDGENFTLRGQQVAEKASVELPESGWFRKDFFLWVPGYAARQPVPNPANRAPSTRATRANYYTTTWGNGVDVEVKEALWQLGFDPHVFSKQKGAKSKGVDITLTRDVLSHAFRGNYDIAVLYAGDRDYVPLVEEIKRIGKIVHICFFESCGMSEELRRSADYFTDVSGKFLQQWKSWSAYTIGPTVERY